MKSSAMLLTPAKEVWGKVIFSVAYVNNSVHGGVCLSACWDTTLQADTPLGTRHPPPRPGNPLHSACWEIWSTSGCYASYWNAILLLPANEVWGKVIFLHLSVILFTRGGVPGPRGLLRGGCLLLGGGGSAPGGGGAWWRPLLRAVRILLECILVSF